MRVKICGITHAADALVAARAGADAIGLNFVGGPRRIEPGAAREILKGLPPTVTPVALVKVDGGRLPIALLELLGELRISYLQVYGAAEAGDAGQAERGDGRVMQAGRPLTDIAAEVGGERLIANQSASPALSRLIAAGFRPMVVLAVKDRGFAAQLAAWGASPPECRPCAVVLDAYDPSREGGTGRTFRWEWVTEAKVGEAVAWPPILLAGGLNPENVGEAVRAVRPDGVDVSSGVEVEGLPGTKDPAKVVAFVRNARAAMDSLGM